MDPNNTNVEDCETPTGVIGLGAVYGAASAALVVLMWLVAFHRKFCVAIWKTNKVTPYGVYTTITEALRTHYWYILCQALGVDGGNSAEQRKAWLARVTTLFLQNLNVLPQSAGSNSGSIAIEAVSDKELQKHQAIISHSCRAIFYYIIKSLLDKSKARTGKSHIKICICSVQFGSFYRLMRGMEKSLDCTIEFLEVDMIAKDWTIDWSSINENDVKSCDLIMAQHLFGVPFEQTKFWEWAQKFDIPIVEDNVQSGSIFGKYKGNPKSDAILYSGGLDKTPSCFGGGFGYFRHTKYGDELYASCRKMHDERPLDTTKARLIAVLNQTIHTMIAQNTLWFNNLVSLLFYVFFTDRGESIQFYKASLKVRKNKSITPFQHAESGFLRHPCVAHLKSMAHGFLKKEQYHSIAREEVRRRQVLLDNIPQEYHGKLFPWWTPAVLKQHEDNLGVSEFSWVNAYQTNDRLDLCKFLNEEYVVCMINTTWEYHTDSKFPVGKDINESLVYLPNINHLDNDASIVDLARVLTKYCVEGGGKATKKLKSL